MPDIVDQTEEILDRLQDEQVERLQSEVSPKLVQTVTEDVDIGNRTSGFAGATDASSVVTQREVDPIAVTRLGGTLPWDTESMQLQCGETVTSSNGDHNVRLVMECVVKKSQFEKLNLMRNNPEEVKLVSSAYTGPVTFDELKFDRIPDANGAITPGDGEDWEPRFTIQLQSKETDGS